jgi:tetratricopeptide (TPR) repeat protein
VAAYNNHGLAYAAKGEYDRAIADYNEAIRLDQKYVFTYNNRGLTYKAKGDLDRAIADYSEAIRLDPKYASAYYDRGNAYGAMGSIDAAVADYDEAVRLDPKLDDHIARLMLGVRAVKRHQFALARQNFSESAHGPVTDLAAALLSAWATYG